MHNMAIPVIVKTKNDNTHCPRLYYPLYHIADIFLSKKQCMGLLILHFLLVIWKMLTVIFVISFAYVLNSKWFADLWLKSTG
jgi:hypothetical protein